jgi:anti-sigma factor RsiW
VKPPTGRIIRLDREGARRVHVRVHELLPWYVAGTLEPDELAEVQAHLPGCAECRAEVEFQRRLDAQVDELPLDVDVSWARMRGRLQPSGRFSAAWSRVRAAAPWAGWAAAACLALAVAAPVLQPRSPPGEYQALSGPTAAAPSGNLVVMFQPETPERDLRAAVQTTGARLVDGPTAAGGWVLSVPAADRDAAVRSLRARPEVVLAEPLERSVR